MQPTIEGSVREIAAAEVFHALVSEDRAVMDAMRLQIEPYKGTMIGPEAREPFDAIMEQVPDAPGVSYERGVVAGVPGVWCRPRNAPSGRFMLFLHGGAYVFGSAHAYRHLAGQIASRANAVAFVADYRRAPEDPFPAALDDALAVYRGLVAMGAMSIALVGDSAGGGLALAMLSGGEDPGIAGLGAVPRAVVALSPWTDLALTNKSLQERAADDPMLTRNMLEKNASSYLQEHNPRDPRVSPLYGRFAGLPSIQIHVGTSEILLDDSLRYASKARQEGIDATAHVWEGMPHVFLTSVGMLDAADRALEMIGVFLQEKLAGE